MLDVIGFVLEHHSSERILIGWSKTNTEVIAAANQSEEISRISHGPWELREKTSLQRVAEEKPSDQVAIGLILNLISNNRTEWSTIQEVIGRMISNLPST